MHFTLTADERELFDAFKAISSLRAAQNGGIIDFPPMLVADGPLGSGSAPLYDVDDAAGHLAFLDRMVGGITQLVYAADSFIGPPDGGPLSERMALGDPSVSDALMVAVFRPHLPARTITWRYQASPAGDLIGTGGPMVDFVEGGTLHNVIRSFLDR
jgi:hypothetical protein